MIVRRFRESDEAIFYLNFLGKRGPEKFLKNFKKWVQNATEGNRVAIFLGYLVL